MTDDEYAQYRAAQRAGLPPVEERFASLATVRANGFTWPRDMPFPWTDAECAAFVRGYQVHWPLDLDTMLANLPGKVEMDEGYAVQWNG